MRKPEHCDVSVRRAVEITCTFGCQVELCLRVQSCLYVCRVLGVLTVLTDVACNAKEEYIDEKMISLKVKLEKQTIQFQNNIRPS